MLNESSNSMFFDDKLFNLIQIIAPHLSIETLADGKDSATSIVKNTHLTNDLALVIKHDLVIIRVGWGNVKSLDNWIDGQAEGFFLKTFREYEDPLWQTHALQYIKTELERTIRLVVSYSHHVPVKIRYDIKMSEKKYQTIGSTRLVKKNLLSLFQPKQEKIFETSLIKSS